MAVTRGKTRAAKAKGGLVKQAMTLIALASSAFILLPAGRDIVSYETSILPGEAETRPLMTMAHSSSRTGMWGIWGLNHCFVALLKVAAFVPGVRTSPRRRRHNSRAGSSPRTRSSSRSSGSSRPLPRPML